MVSLEFPMCVLELSLVLMNSVDIEHIGKHDFVYVCQYLATKCAFLPVPSFVQYPCDHHDFC